MTRPALGASNQPIFVSMTRCQANALLAAIDETALLDSRYTERERETRAEAREWLRRPLVKALALAKALDEEARA